MKLYYSPGACSLAPHIVARELGIPVTLEKVDIRAGKTANGKDYKTINPKGYVPAFELDSGEVLTEGPVISQYLADLKPDAGLAPPNGTMARYRLQEMLGYINSEIHKTYSPLFNPAITPEQRERTFETLRRRYTLLDQTLSRSPLLLGDQFTIADAYLYVVTRWAAMMKLDLSGLTSLQAFQQRVEQRPAVKTALKEEGLA